MTVPFCKDHTDCIHRISRLEQEDKLQWKKISSMDTKLNLILGGIIVSPFIVSLITLLIKVKI